MKRVFKVFVLTQPEQRVIIVLILLVLAFAWYKHSRDLQNTLPARSAPSASPSPR